MNSPGIVVDIVVQAIFDIVIPEITGWEDFKTRRFVSGMYEWVLGTDWNDNLQADCWDISGRKRTLLYSTAFGIPKTSRAVEASRALPVFVHGMIEEFPVLQHFRRPK